MQLKRIGGLLFADDFVGLSDSCENLQNWRFAFCG